MGALGEEPERGEPERVDRGGRGGQGLDRLWWVCPGGVDLVGKAGTGIQKTKRNNEKTTKKGRKSEPEGRKLVQKVIKTVSGCPPGAEAEKEAKKRLQ